MKMSVEIEYLTTIHTGRSHPYGEPEYCNQYNRLRIVRNCSAPDVMKLRAKYQAPRFRIHTWEAK